MVRGVNRVILIGNVGEDPQLSNLPSGDVVANLSIATSETWKDKTTGVMQERTEWHRVVFFRRLGEIVGDYVRKGSKLYIDGSLRTRKWQDAGGIDRYTTEVVASEMQMLDSNSRSQDNGSAGEYNQQPQNEQYDSAPPPAARGRGQQPGRHVNTAKQNAPTNNGRGRSTRGGQQQWNSDSADNYPDFNVDLPFNVNG